MFWPCCSLISFKALLYFRHLYYFSWDHVFRALLFIQSALFIMFEPTITLGALLFYLERFYFTWSAFILLGALLFFLQSAFLFLHSAFLILHSASLKFSVWVSTCIFSLIVSQRAILFILVQLLLILKCEALISWLMSEIFDDIMCINSSINFVQNF